MPVILDLKKQNEADKVAGKQQGSKEKTSAPAVKGYGRPKGAPAVTRSIRIKTDINARLIKAQEETGASYNELVNRALDSYLP